MERYTQMATNPYLSVVIPVHNEEKCLEELYLRLTKALDALGKTYEIILTNDGSTDNTTALLKELHLRRPQSNSRHQSGIQRGQLQLNIWLSWLDLNACAVKSLLPWTLTCKLSPEEISETGGCHGRAGHDVVNTYRLERQDTWWRLFVSFLLHNKIRAWMMPKLKMQDEGCMLRAYRREIVWT